MVETLLEKFDASIADLVNKRLVLAVSGGVDSVVMLNLFCESPYIKCENLVIAHLDHGIRDDSNVDFENVKLFALKLGVKFVGKKVSLRDSGGNLEARARKMRYDFFESVRVEYNADFVVTAHHAGDQAETVFMKFLMGTFIKGFAGMSAIDSSRKIVRPLLAFSKEELINYCVKKKLIYRDDVTNFDTDFNRNFLRHDIFPKLESRFQGFGKRLCGSASYYTELADFLDGFLIGWASENIVSKFDGVAFQSSHFKLLPQFLKFTLCEQLFDTEFSKSDFCVIDRLLSDGKSGKYRKIGKKYAYISFGEVFISTLDLNSLRAKKIPNTFVVPKGKKLKRILYDKKVPWYFRDL